VTATTVVFSSRLYPRPAVEAVAAKFAEVCPLALAEVPEGTRATITLPLEGREELTAEFCNAVLAAAIEMHLGMVAR
jgi:hypothetical protein